MKKIIFIILFITSLSFAQNYSLIKVYLTNSEDIGILASTGAALDEAWFDKKNKSLSLFVSGEELNKINNLPLKTEILIENWQQHFNNRSQVNDSELRIQRSLSKNKFNVSGFGFGSHAGFYTVEEVYNKLDSMRLKYPSLITSKVQIGTTVQGRPIYAVKISDSPDMDEEEPEVFYNSMIHAREPQGMMVLMYFMYYLLENYSIDPEVTYLVNNRELYFVPVINVDGYKKNIYDSPAGGGMYRRNLNGVDLNRNFGYQWGYDNFGSSPYSTSETYRGPSSFSEPETRAIRDFCNAREFKSALNYHTFSNLLISPWGYVNQESPDSLIFRDFSAEMTKYNYYAWGTAGDLLYNTNGDADDWMYGEQVSKSKIISMTPEVGSNMDGFWPAKNRIFPLAQENLYPNLYLAWTAGAYVVLSDYYLSKEYFNPGETIEITPVFTNKGLGDAGQFTAEIISLNENAVIEIAELSFAGLNSRNKIQSPSSFRVNISQSASVVDNLPLVIKVKTGNQYISADTIFIQPGIPQVIYDDTTTVITSGWTTGSIWSITTSDFHTPPGCYTDSKSGLYRNGMNASLIMKNQVDLKGYFNPVLSFYTKYDIERGWDYGQVKVSTNNGFSWTALKGRHTHPGNTYQVSEPVYDGQQSDWVKEEINLNAYSGSKIKIRFDLITDAATQKDGWYIDDIKIIYYAVLPVEVKSFSLTPQQNMVKISWSTASELNNSGFNLQRSADGENWSTIAFVKGYGTSSEPNSYLYFDKSPFSARCYYRLEQIDYNGTKNIIELGSIDATGIYDYFLSQNYPNPFNPESIIHYTLAEPGMVKLQIFDITGREVMLLVNEYQEAGWYAKKLNANELGLSSGTYIYSLHVNGYSSQRKLMILK